MLATKTAEAPIRAQAAAVPQWELRLGTVPLKVRGQISERLSVVDQFVDWQHFRSGHQRQFHERDQFYRQFHQSWWYQQWQLVQQHHSGYRKQHEHEQQEQQLQPSVIDLTATKRHTI